MRIALPAKPGVIYQFTTTPCASLTDFGAKGDGVTDDGPAFQAMINAVATNCLVNIPPGKYRIATQVNVSKALQWNLAAGAEIICDIANKTSAFLLTGTGLHRWIGAGDATIRQKTTGFPEPYVFYWTTQSVQLEVRGITFVADVGNSLAFFFYTGSGGHDLLFENLVFKNEGASIFTAFRINSPRTTIRFVRIYLTGTVSTGVHDVISVFSASATDCDISNVAFVYSGVNPTIVQNGIYVGADRCSIRNVSFTGLGGNAKDATEILLATVKSILISNCSFIRTSVSTLTTAAQAIAQGSNTSPGDINVEGCSFFGHWYAIDLGASLGSGLHVRGCSFTSHDVGINPPFGGGNTQWGNTFTSVRVPVGEPQKFSQTADAKIFQSRRFGVNGATALAAANFTLGAGWGTGPTLAIAAGSTDQRGRITITAGTTPAANPTWTLTFADGAFPAAPFAVVTRNGGDQDGIKPTWTVSTTALTVTWPGTPVAGATYTFEWVLL